MLVGICGGICAGKKTVADYFIRCHGFRLIVLVDKAEPCPEPFDESKPVFNSIDALLNFATIRWREPWVLVGIKDPLVVDILETRPSFLLISVEAPVSESWIRHSHRIKTLPLSATAALSSQATDIHEFIRETDANNYSPDVRSITSRAAIRLINNSPNVNVLLDRLTNHHFEFAQRMRPSWDMYFMSLAALASKRSNCMKRRVGCVLVTRENRVISTGYNGTPRGLCNCSDGGCPRCNSGGSGSGAALSTCLCLHAEENALLEAGRDRIREGSVLYCDTCPCLTCSIKICQVGISEVVYNQGYTMDRDSAKIFSEAGVKLRKFVPPPNTDMYI
ncbi:Deoxycytidine monophosphate (dCMP) deaminase [Ceratocystis pirilliformis]|uniref:dCMP deaminase n=1 Tax=Ceratocystis pirilliformis TaxID=259994 RepID=A0ABR3YR15_9PEZI